MNPIVPACAPAEFRYIDNVLTFWERAIGNEFLEPIDVTLAPNVFVPYAVGFPFSSKLTQSFGLYPACARRPSALTSLSLLG